MPPNKEIHYFGKDLDFRGERPSKHEYLQLFEGSEAASRIGETSVWYLYSKTAAREIRQFCGEIDIIVLLRDPVEMLHSLHSQFLVNGTESITDFEAALSAEADRRRGKRIPRGAVPPQVLRYRETVKYAEQLERYFDCFGRDRVLVHLFEDFVNDTEGAYEKTLKFLSVNTSFRPEFEKKNPNEEIRSIYLRDLVESPPSLLRKIASAALPRVVRSNLKEAVRSLNIYKDERNPMSLELEKRLRKELYQDILDLEELLDRNLNHWREV